jgi:hypothetical protein
VLDNVGDVYTAGTSYLAAFAIQAQLQGLVKIGRVLQAVTFTVGAGLFGAGIVGGYSGNRADCGADAAFGTLLEVVLAEVAYLHSFSHNISLKNHQSNRYLSIYKPLVEVLSAIGDAWLRMRLFALSDVVGGGNGGHQ